MLQLNRALADIACVDVPSFNQAAQRAGLDVVQAKAQAMNVACDTGPSGLCQRGRGN